MTEQTIEQTTEQIAEKTEEKAILRDFNFTLSDVLKMPDSKYDVHRLVVAIAGEPIILTKGNGDEYLDIPIGDKTGSTLLRVWDAVQRAKDAFQMGSIWSIQVTKGSWAGKEQLTFKAGDSRLVGKTIMEVDEDIRDFARERLIRSYPVPAKPLSRLIQLFQLARPELKHILSQVFGLSLDLTITRFKELTFEHSHNELAFLMSDRAIELMIDTPALNRSAEQCLADLRRFVHAPAAKSNHGNYLHGLIAHVEGMDKLACALSSEAVHFPALLNMATDPNDKDEHYKLMEEAIDFELIRVACYIHDYYKIKEYDWTPLGGISYAQDAPLFYHDMLMAFQLMTLKASAGHRLEEQTDYDKLTEVIMTHHGQWAEYQPSKYRNHYAENFIFHTIDNLEAKISEAFDGMAKR